jgi:hypothetical protein
MPNFHVANVTKHGTIKDLINKFSLVDKISTNLGAFGVNQRSWPNPRLGK